MTDDTVTFMQKTIRRTNNLLLCVLAAIGILAAACGSISESSRAQDELPPTPEPLVETGESSDESTDPTSADTDQRSDESPDPASALLCGDRPGTIESPCEFGDVVRYQDWTGADWDISIDEVRIDAAAHRRNETDRCVLVIGSAALFEASTGQAGSSTWSLPQVQIVVNGQILDDELFACDHDPIEAEGILRRLDLQLIPGGTGRFFEEFAIGDGDEVQVVLVEGEVAYGN